MPIFTLKEPRKLGERDEKYGQSYWAFTHESQLPVKFNLMEGEVSDGQKITCEEATTRTSSKGKDYQQLKKVRPQGAQTEAKWQPRDNDAIRAQWAIGQAMTHFAPKENVKLNDVETLAKALFGMVDRVKTGEQVVEPDEDTVYDTDDEPINLDNIPF